MEAHIKRLLVRSAEGKGWDARRDGRSCEECPFIESHLRAAWKAGWERAHRSMF
jgi:ribosome modulation factor